MASTISGNTATSSGGGILSYYAPVSLDGGAVTENSAVSGGGALIYGTTLDSSDVDWGTAKSDNAPDDVSLSGTTTYDSFGSGSTFSCDERSCE